MKTIYINKQSILSNRQSGVALFVSLALLLVLTIIGLTAAKRSSMQESMGTNLHVKNLSFNAAESAIGGFLIESFTEDKNDPKHILSKIRTSEQPITDICYNEAGARVKCGKARLDADHGGIVNSQLTAETLKLCSQGSCSGYSLNGSVGCHLYQLEATGTANNNKTTTQLIAFEVAACAQ